MLKPWPEGGVGDPGAAPGAGQAREALVARWLALTRRTLPGMAAAQRWPIRLDHCFMRVCLDEAMGGPWTEVLSRPAIRSMTDGQLTAAIGVAEAIVARPALLAGLNARSLERRRALRAFTRAAPNPS